MKALYPIYNESIGHNAMLLLCLTLQCFYGIIISKRRNESMVSKAKIAANARYNVKKYDVVSFRVSKDESINQRIDEAIAAINAGIPRKEDQISKASFILDAIKAQLDGQPAAAPAPEPAAAPAQIPIGMEYLNILLPTAMHYNERISEAVYNGAAKSARIFVMQALDRRLHEADQMM
jgi:hypothetical protein